MDNWLVHRVRAATVRRVIAWLAGFCAWILLFAPSVFSAGHRWDLLVIPLPLFLGAVDLAPLFPGLFRPTADPQISRLANWGLLDEISRQAQEEMGQGRLKAGRWIFTEHLLIHNGLFKFEVYPLWHMLWAYRLILHTYYGTSDDCAVLCFYGATAEMRVGKRKVDEVLRYVGDCAPWAIVGFSKELKRAFTDRNAEFCADVEERRQRWLGRISPDAV